MRALPLGAKRVDEALRVVRALGSHRYVAGRLHLVHAFAFAALDDGADEVLGEARAWARAMLDNPRVDAASRDEALWRRVNEAELVATLAAYWTPGDGAERPRERLRRLLARHELVVGDHPPFDESIEDEIHPLLVDAGWELVPLASLDPERHRGAMAAFGDDFAFECARFEEETAVPAPTYLVELPAFGPVELLRGADELGVLAAPLVVWADGNETYLDYVVRGVRRAAKLPERDPGRDDQDNPDSS
jgi:hypothetical protein